MRRKNEDKLRLWQDRLSDNQSAYEGIVSLMAEREQLYQGKEKIEPLFDNEDPGKTPHLRNIVYELVEAVIDSSIPQPKVTPTRREDENLAIILENKIRNELDRMPFEGMNDLMERVCNIQGGAFFLVEWDNSARAHTTIGELVVSIIHPKQIVPQAGIYSRLSDMDYIIIKLPQTKASIKKRYKVNVDDEDNSEPGLATISGADGDQNGGDDMVTQYQAYYKNKSGGIGLYSWVNDVELVDMEDYQARRLRRCETCGAAEPLDVEPMLDKLFPAQDPIELPDEPLENSSMPLADPVAPGKKICPYCGGTKFSLGEVKSETLPFDTPTRIGVIPAGTEIPYYKPDVFPLVMRRSVSQYGQLLGDSIVDQIKSQQNTLNRINKKMADKLVEQGSFVTMPNDAALETGPDDMKVYRIENAADMEKFRVYTVQGNIEADMNYSNRLYEEARQITGVTDSFLGRRDTTATSGKAKEFAAAQTAGRLESGKIMKQAAFADLFEVMAKFLVAYTDEPRSVISQNYKGKMEYQSFSRYDFLRQDDAGDWYYNIDNFLFSCDASALATNRESMWQETVNHFSAGTYGDPTSFDTLILYWTTLEGLHYPGAADKVSYFEEQQKKQELMQQQQQAMMMQQQQALQAARQEAAFPIQPKGGIPNG